MSAKIQKFVADPAVGKANLSAAIQKLNQGLAAVATPSGLRRHLTTVALRKNLQRYSLRNQILILMQCPEATHVGTFAYWLKLGRLVQKGEGVHILAPRQFVKRVEVDADDHPEAEVGEDGKAFIERAYRSYKTITVWDISKTTDRQKRPYVPPVGPAVVSSFLTTDDEDERAYLIDMEARAWATGRGARVRAYDEPGCHGSCTSDGLVSIGTRRDSLGVCKTALHEIAHYLEFALGTRSTYDLGELVAESVAFCVLQRYGLDTSGYSFGYIQGYGGDQRMLQRGLSAIQRISAEIIAGLEADDAAPQKEEAA